MSYVLLEVIERPKVRHWKCRVVSQPPRVRIPPSPLVTCYSAGCYVAFPAASVWLFFCTKCPCTNSCTNPGSLPGEFGLEGVRHFLVQASARPEGRDRLRERVGAVLLTAQITEGAPAGLSLLVAVTLDQIIASRIAGSA